MIKKKIYVFLLAACMLPATLVRAGLPVLPNEGMWLMSLLKMYNIAEMKKMGCELTADQIYSETNPSLKDAIVQLGGFCTAEFVSDQGLLFTNHHCGFEAVASQSSTEHNYLDEGFLAKTHDAELPIPGLWIRILVKMQDITDSIAPKVASMDQMSRVATVKAIQDRITARETEKTGDYVEIKSMYYGNQYFIFYYQQYNDVRLVGAPPSSIGKFGGDTDNWMWPRHTGDFSMFRVYADKDNKPAEYSKDNVPYKPKKHLDISLNGFSKNSYTMIMGFPGSTERYLTSFAMKQVIEESNPAQIALFKTVTDMEKQQMDKSEAVRIQLASDYAQLMNALKLYEGQIQGMNSIDAMNYKKQQEDQFMKWVNTQPDSIKNKYSSLMTDFGKAYVDLKSAEAEFYYKIYPVVLMPTGNFSLELQSLEAVLADSSSTPEAIKDAEGSLEPTADEMFKNMDYATEQKKVAALLNLLYTKLPKNEQPEMMAVILQESNGSTPEEKFNNWSKKAFEQSVFTTEDKFESFLKNPSLAAIENDELYQWYLSLFSGAMQVRPMFVSANQSINRLERIYIDGMMRMNPKKAYYPDANFTMRLTYGKILDYDPRDAVHYQYQTYLKGVMEKMDNTNEEFKVDDKLVQLYKNKDFGRYKDKTGDVPVCFLSDNDITGGNSGSPVMNGKGQLIGLAFDGNYEGTAGDYIFDPALNRTISVDIRYVMFVVDKFMGADNLMKEISIAPAQ